MNILAGCPTGASGCTTTSFGEIEYQYDGFGRLVQVEEPAGFPVGYAACLRWVVRPERSGRSLRHFCFWPVAARRHDPREIPGRGWA